MFKAKPGSYVLRIKTSMQDKDPAFRDRVLFRISGNIHPKVKEKVWPMLEFGWAIDDHLLGITHIIRGKELMMESKMERYIWDIFKWKHPEIMYNGLIQLEGVKISKSKSAKEVLDGKYSGWDDPRTWSLQSLERRGIKKEALRKFLLKFGINATEIVAPIEDLYNENKKLIESSSRRYFFIEDAVKIKIIGAPERKIKLRLHPEKNFGFRNFSVGEDFYVNKKDFSRFKNGKIYRLMDCLNFVKKGDRFVFDSLEYSKYKEKGESIIHWLPMDTVDVSVVMDNGFLLKGKGEKNLKNVKVDDIVQFERFGFVRCDSKKMVFWFGHK